MDLEKSIEEDIQSANGYSATIGAISEECTVVQVGYYGDDLYSQDSLLNTLVNKLYNAGLLVDKYGNPTDVYVYVHLGKNKTEFSFSINTIKENLKKELNQLNFK